MKMKLRVKSIPVANWCNEEAVEVIEAFNRSKKHLVLDMYNEKITTLDQLGTELEQGMYDFVYPKCAEATRLREVIESAEEYPRYLSFGVEDIEVEQSANIVTRCSADMVRNMCIKHNYYTKGDCEAYDTLLGSIYEIRLVTGDIIYRIAKDIKEHSDTEDSVKDIANNILKEACTTYIIEYLEY